MRIARALSAKGMIGFFAVDYLMTQFQEKSEIWAIEINIRQGGTTHPYQTAKLLTNANYIEKKGILVDQKEKNIFYKSNDNFTDQRLIGKTATELLEFINKRSIVFSPQSNKGVVFHMLGALKDHGKIGYTIIAHDNEEIKMITAHLHSLMEEFLNL